MKGGTWDLGVLVGLYMCLAQNEGDISFLRRTMILAAKDNRMVCLCLVNNNSLASIPFPPLLFAFGRIRDGTLLIENTGAHELTLLTLTII